MVNIPFIGNVSPFGFGGLIGLINFIGVIWMLVDLLKSYKRGLDTFIWALVILIVPFGWVIYYFLEKR